MHSFRAHSVLAPRLCAKSKLAFLRNSNGRFIRDKYNAQILAHDDDYVSCIRTYIALANGRACLNERSHEIQLHEQFDVNTQAQSNTQ